ncbi:MAG: hypothetical protein R2713_07610 [Ilumatobacteraceae bacterium]
MRRQLDLAAETAPVFRTALPGGGELTRELTIAARLLNADLGLRFLDVSREASTPTTGKERCCQDCSSISTPDSRRSTPPCSRGSRTG